MRWFIILILIPSLSIACFIFLKYIIVHTVEPHRNINFPTHHRMHLQQAHALMTYIIYGTAWLAFVLLHVAEYIFSIYIQHRTQRHKYFNTPAKYQKLRFFIFQYWTLACISYLLVRAIFIEYHSELHHLKIISLKYMFHLIAVLSISTMIQQVLKAFHDEKHLTSLYKKAQLSSLQAQMNPHFLFNTLNMINNEIDTSPSNASNLLCTFCDVLRTSLEMNKHTFITVKDELKFINNYIKIQQNRFGSRFVYHEDIKENTLNTSIPPFIIQPFIENILVHGFANTIKDGFINLIISKQHQRLCIEIIDNGAGFNLSTQKVGNGTRIVQELLYLHFENKAILEITTQPNEGCAIRIELPIT